MTEDAVLDTLTYSFGTLGDLKGTCTRFHSRSLNGSANSSAKHHYCPLVLLPVNTGHLNSQKSS